MQQERSAIADRLAEVAGLSREEAQQRLLDNLDAELQEEQGRIIAKRVKDAEENAKVKARELVSRAIQRYAAEHTAETTTAKVIIPDEEMKGRIIGKEGRNIRAFSQASGVDVIIDDAPGQITLSCFDPVRREIARRALVDLIEDGRIHPARIEEVMARTQQEMEQDVLQYGEDAAFACEVSGLHPQLLKLLGKLQFRTSYGQNVLKHSQEVAFLCGAMAADLGLDPRLGRRCGLLHDIGKAIDHEQEGSHPELGYEALKRYNENEIVGNAALAHHEGHEVISVYTTLAAAADAISAARPGARRENVERYIKRLEQIEDIACDFKGVMKAYAIQAGREVRVWSTGTSSPTMPCQSSRAPSPGASKTKSPSPAKSVSPQSAKPGKRRWPGKRYGAQRTPAIGRAGLPIAALRGLRCYAVVAEKCKLPSSPAECGGRAAAAAAPALAW